MGSTKKIAQTALLEFGLNTARRLLSKKTVQSTLRAQLRRLLTGRREKPYRTVPAVEAISDKIVQRLTGNIPQPACIGIDGVAGSGKSTLGRSLSQKLNLKWRTLYGREMDRPLDLKRGTIYENIRLFRTQDMDCFDAIIYLDTPIDVSKDRVLSRDRNGTLIDFLDYDKLRRIGDLAFAATDGEVITIPDSTAKLKLRPTGGYGLRKNLLARLADKSIDTDSRCTEELLFLIEYGDAQKGIRPYVNLGAYNRDFLASAYTSLLIALDQLS